MHETNQLVKDIKALVCRVEAAVAGLPESAPGRAALRSTEDLLTRAVVAAEVAARRVATG